MKPIWEKENRSPTIAEFQEASSKDSNLWWRLDSGDHQNLFDEAIDKLVEMKATIDEIAKAIHYPRCWDTMAYPTLLSAIQEHAFCSECEEPIVREADKELAELREWKADVEESHRRIMSEQCPTDEVHCTCVPVLRKENADMKAKIAALTQALAHESRKAADFERLVMEGELVEHSMVSKWLTSGSCMSLKQFAKERQK